MVFAAVAVEGDLVTTSANFASLITATPTVFGLTAAQATAYGVVNTAYATAYAAAIDPSTRTPVTVSAKNTARKNLRNEAKLFAKIVEATLTVTDSQLLSLGLTPRTAPAPVPVPSDGPSLRVVSVSGFIVKIRLGDAASGSKRGKPPGVSGAAVFSHVGETAPLDIGAWQFEGNTGRVTVDVQFPNTIAAGAKVWITSFWFNGRKQSGPLCAPVSTNLQGGSVSMAA